MNDKIKKELDKEWSDRGNEYPNRKRRIETVIDYALSSQKAEIREKVKKEIDIYFIENIFKDFYEGDWYQNSGDSMKLYTIADRVKQDILKAIEL